MSEGKPLCKCHGEPMFWHKDSRVKRGGFWECVVKGRESKRRWMKENREKAKDLGLCIYCHVREAEPLMATCIRCLRYHTEYSFLGYSTIPLAKGSEG